VKRKRLSFLRRQIALTIFVGALPFIFNASAHAEETGESKWLDDYHQPVGLTYGAKATLNSTYIWRGLYSGATNVQLDANVGYGGLYADMWWNIGTEEWSFTKFQPEVDISIGFERWGLNVYVLYIHNFNCGFFDFANYADKGNRLELNAIYTVSSKLPLSFRWGTRVSAADGYLNEQGELKYAYSSYAEISYTQALPYDLSLFGAVGLTPWRSVYTGYRSGFGVTNIDIRLRKDWTLSEHCGLMLMGQLTLNPYLLATDKESVAWHVTTPWNQSINANIGVGVYLK